MKKKNSESKSVVKYKILYTLFLFFGYMLGKSIPLYGVDHAAYAEMSVDAQKLLQQTIGGDIHRVSLFAVGISPYMISMLIVQIVSAFRRTNKKIKVSAIKSNRITLLLTLIIAVTEASVNVQNLNFIEGFAPLYLMKIIAAVEMVTGAMLVLWIVDRNSRYGIGGQTAFICVNVLEGLMRIFAESSAKELIVPLCLGLVSMVIMILLENTEKHISVQRISIYNIYADKNYLAIKLNPIGVMPVMFSTAFFMLPKLIIEGMSGLFPGNAYLDWWERNMELTEPVGIGIYIAILFALTVGFALIFLSPEDLTEQLLKSGDCLTNIHAGRDTKRYLTGNLLLISIFSAVVMGSCVGLPLILQMQGLIVQEAAMLPASSMMLTGICCNLFREYKTMKTYDSYKMIL